MSSLKSDYINKNDAFQIFFEKYRNFKEDDVRSLTSFFDGLELNKNYFRTGLKNNHKFKANKDTDTYTIKLLNNNLNKISSINKDSIISEIMKECKGKIHLYPYYFDTILQKTITHSNYIDCYAQIIKDIVSDSTKGELIKSIDKMKEQINISHRIERKSYDSLCDITLYTEKIYGLNLLLVKLEKYNVLEDYIENNIKEFFSLLNHTEDDNIIYRILSCIDQINTEIGNILGEEEINMLISFKETVKPKNKFKIMDILAKYN